jgi:hypothetical protein
MRMTIRTWTGTELDGIAMAVYGSTMRVAIRGRKDIAEFVCSGGCWFSETGEPVEIEFETHHDPDSLPWAEVVPAARRPETSALVN